MKSSGYNRKTSREIVFSGTLGWKRKIKRREQEGTELYRSARSTLAGRCRKKLLEKVTWYKTKRKRDGDEETDEQQHSPRKRMKRDAPGQRDQQQPRDTNKTKTNTSEMHKENVKAVMFVPYIVDSMLAKRIRDVENTLQEMTGYRLKIVERSGTKLEDVLAKADPWQGQECCRKCLLCLIKQRTGKQSTQDCTRRTIVYESW